MYLNGINSVRHTSYFTDVSKNDCMSYFHGNFLMCGYMMGLQCHILFLGVSALGLSFRKNMLGAYMYLLYYLR